MIARPPSMPASEDVFGALVRLRERGLPCVLATVVRTAGSTPRKQAARMLVTFGRPGQDRGSAHGASSVGSAGSAAHIVGTIGGGRVEKEVIDACLALLVEPSPRPRLCRYHLTHELAMCCGGEMEVFMEPIVPEPPLIVCGAGHVARALVPIARSVGFLPTVVDEATDEGQEFASPARFPDAARIVDSYDPRDWKGVPLDERSYVVIVTRDHATDQKLLESLIGIDLAYLGLIGSRRKIAMFRERLVAKGVPRERLDRMRAPIGLSIGAETPEEIAVAIVAELIEVRATKKRALRGDPPATDGKAETGAPESDP